MNFSTDSPVTTYMYGIVEHWTQYTYTQTVTVIIPYLLSNLFIEWCFIPSLKKIINHVTNFSNLRRLILAGHLGDKKNAYRILVPKCEVQRPLGIPRHRPEITLIWILWKPIWRVWVGIVQPRTGNNQQCKEFRDQLSVILTSQQELCSTELVTFICYCYVYSYVFRTLCCVCMSQYQFKERK